LNLSALVRLSTAMIFGDATIVQRFDDVGANEAGRAGND
jgi:hypothetical protein